MNQYGRPQVCTCTRRTLLAGGGSLAVGFALPAAAAEGLHAAFVRAAVEMREQAVTAGDQPYGAVVVQGDRIVGFGPSRVVEKRDATAHAEREAIRDAQFRLKADDLVGCVMYSTSRPCSACEQAAARANIARMYHGPQPTDAGRPRGG